MTETASIDELNKLLKGEISACETYKIALEKIDDPSIKMTLQENHQSHTGRVGELQQAVSALGGKPADGSGIWGAFAMLMEGGATAFGDKAAIDVLEEGEDRGLADYRGVMDRLVTSSSIEKLLSKQEMTHSAMSNLKKLLAS